jgi:hypothetical protein
MYKKQLHKVNKEKNIQIRMSEELYRRLETQVQRHSGIPSMNNLSKLSRVLLTEKVIELEEAQRLQDLQTKPHEFVIAQSYTRNQIREYIGGGSIQMSFPSSRNQILAACVKQNLVLPENVIMISNGARHLRLALRALDQIQKKAVPYFSQGFHNLSGSWIYQGQAIVDGSDSYILHDDKYSFTDEAKTKFSKYLEALETNSFHGITHSRQVAHVSSDIVIGYLTMKLVS